MTSKRRQRSFAISHSANKKPKYSHSSGLELLSSSEDNTDLSSSMTHSVSRESTCLRCKVLNNEVKWLRSRVEKYEEKMQARVEELERLLFSLGERKDNKTSDVLHSTYTSAMPSVPEAVVNFGEISVPSVENPNVSVITEVPVLPGNFPFIPEVLSGDVFPLANISDISVIDNSNGDNNNDCI